MQTLSELTTRLISPVAFKRRDEKAQTLTAPLRSSKVTPDAIFEVDVLNFLLKNKDELGIQTVLRFTNLKVDGAVVLSDGKRLAVEVKYRMNWLKACQAEYEFKWFLKTQEALRNPVTGAIVFFEEFSGDWADKAKSRAIVDGWDRWYERHCEVEGKRMDLLRLSGDGDRLEGYP